MIQTRWDLDDKLAESKATGNCDKSCNEYIEDVILGTGPVALDLVAFNDFKSNTRVLPLNNSKCEFYFKTSLWIHSKDSLTFIHMGLTHNLRENAQYRTLIVKNLKYTNYLIKTFSSYHSHNLKYT
jgi:hypothetical protein